MGDGEEIEERRLQIRSNGLRFGIDTSQAFLKLTTTLCKLLLIRAIPNIQV